VKLLFDQNVAPGLVKRLADLFPDSNHVYPLNLFESSDLEVWSFGAQYDFVVVSKDADFSELSMNRGFPPKLVWLRMGNCTTAEIEHLLRTHATAIAELYADPARGILEIHRNVAG
jgi:predicted nuclease of predicted toxin-antitoxin system